MNNAIDRAKFIAVTMRWYDNAWKNGREKEALNIEALINSITTAPCEHEITLTNKMNLRRAFRFIIDEGKRENILKQLEDLTILIKGLIQDAYDKQLEND